MGAYDNPQMIQTYADQMAKNITTFYQGAVGAANTLKAAHEQKVKKAEKDLKEAEKKEADTYGGIDSAIAKLENDSKGFLGLTDEREAADLQKQIKANLELIRSKMDTEITDDMSLREINQIKSKYIAQVGTFKEDLDNLAAAYQEWNDSKGLKPNQEGAIVPSYNPEMISIFKAFDDDKYNVRIIPRQDGGFEISELDFNKPSQAGGYEVSNSLNLTDWRRKSQTDGYFQNATKLDLKDIEDDTLDLIKDGTFGTKMTRPKIGTDSQGKPLKGTETYFVFDQAKFDKWKKTPAAQQYAGSLVDSKNARGYWQALGELEKAPTTVPIIDAATGQPQINPNNNKIVTQQIDIEQWKPYKGQEFSSENLQNAIFDIMADKYSQATNIQ